MRILRTLIPTAKIAVWLAIYIIGILFLAVFRLLFLLTHRPLVGDSAISTVLQSFLVGLKFDSAVLSYVILPLFLFSMLPFIKFSSRKTQRVFVCLLTVIFGIFFLMSSADIRYFDVFGSRMNYWLVEYIQYPGMFLYSSATDPGFWKLFLLWLAATALFFLIIRKTINRIAEINFSAGLINRIVCSIIAVALLVLGIRGGLGIKPLDWGAAFHCDNPFLNQLSLNSVYTFAHSLYEELQEGRTVIGHENNRFAFYDINDAYRTTCEMLHLDSADITEDFTLEHSTDSYDRPGFQPNVVVIIMESWSADMIGAFGSKLGVTPRFDSLCARGILFRDFYANGVRTNRGIPAVLCSFPSLAGRSIMNRYAADRPFRSLAEILKENRYFNAFAYGGDIQFDNMEGFLRMTGYEKFYDESDFDGAKKLGKWGIPDHVVFNRLVKEMTQYRRPFHLAVMTLSNHDPYLIPDKRFQLYDDTVSDSKLLNTFYYSDWAIGQFIDSLKKEPLFDSTIFIFTADHCPHQEGKYPLAPRNFHIPLLIYAPKLIGDTAVVIDKTGSQVDIVPTLIDILGLSVVQYSWGRDLLNLPVDDSGFAVIVAEDRLGLIEGSRFFFNWLGSGKLLYNLSETPYLEHNLLDAYPDNAIRMERRLNSYIELAVYLSRGGKR